MEKWHETYGVQLWSVFIEIPKFLIHLIFQSCGGTDWGRWIILARCWPEMVSDKPLAQRPALFTLRPLRYSLHVLFCRPNFKIFILYLYLPVSYTYLFSSINLLFQPVPHLLQNWYSAPRLSIHFCFPSDILQLPHTPAKWHTLFYTN